MDRAQIATILQRATDAVDLGQAAQQLLTELSQPRGVQINSTAILGDDSSTNHIIPCTGLQWSANFYPRVFFDGMTIEPQLRTYIAAVTPVPALIAQVRAGQGGILKRLFNPQAIRDAESAVFDLMVALEQISESAAAIKDLITGATAAREAQASGVQLFPGTHGVGQLFLDAAQDQLSQELEVSGGRIFPWDGQFLRPARSIVQRYMEDPNSEFRLRRQADQCLSQLNHDRVQVLLAQLPVEALRTATNQRLRFGSLAQINVVTVADVLNVTGSVLTTVPGIGSHTAQRMKAAAQTLENEALARQTTIIGDTPSQPAMELVKVLARFEQAEHLSDSERQRRTRVIDYVQQIPEAAGTEPYIVVGSGADLGTHAWNQFCDDLNWITANPNLFHPQNISEPRAEIWSDYLTRPAHYQGLLATLLGRDSEGADELLDASILQRIRELSLDNSLLKDLHLRGYQSFGARFCIVQHKIVLGDDMGLGKTVQALAVAAHLIALKKAARSLVVAPASVIVNWARECRRFTQLPVFIAHGEGKENSVAAWQASNGILICTYDGARTMEIPVPGLIIVDEAHMIKNPSTKRSQALKKLIDATPYALLMTGTPLENKVAEFVNLVRYVQPDLISAGMSAMSAVNFRERIAPAYLRRNQADVLDELPERTDSIEWIELTPQDQLSYAEQVKQGSWMGMRRSAMLSAKSQQLSAKMQRIVELLDEAAEHGRKALIFTYFLDVLDELTVALGSRVAGRIAGDVPAQTRQNIVDSLVSAPAGSALIAQISAGGIGLNIQSASLCIICEPQVKPTIEQQAVARVHRMGQTATVQVHRLIGDETVDERMLEMLAGKQEIFDVYARLSESAEVADAVDITESQLATQIIDAERARLGI